MIAGQQKDKKKSERREIKVVIIEYELVHVIFFAIFILFSKLLNYFISPIMTMSIKSPVLKMPYKLDSTLYQLDYHVQ